LNAALFSGDGVGEVASSDAAESARFLTAGFFDGRFPRSGESGAETLVFSGEDDSSDAAEFARFLTAGFFDVRLSRSGGELGAEAGDDGFDRVCCFLGGGDGIGAFAARAAFSPRDSCLPRRCW
jgi:hypothetical protein